MAMFVAGACALLALRVLLAFRLPVNSDEPQHLHVAWAWLHGYVPYRDVFDNHAPLFQMLFSPLLALIGERADIVPLARLAMIPLYMAALGLTFAIGRTLFSSRVGITAALIATAAPVFMQVSVEYRPDQLWMVLWLAAIAVGVSALPARQKYALAGLIVGAAFATSLKTVLLAAASGGAAIAVAWLAGWPRAAMSRRDVALFAAFALLVPGIVVVYLVHVGAAQAALYCLFSHNVDAGLGHWRHAEWRLLALLGCPAAMLVTRNLLRPQATRVALLRCLAMLTTAFYMSALYAFWPLVTHQDLLPMLPIVYVGIAAIVHPPEPAVSRGRLVDSLGPATAAIAVGALCVANLASVLLLDADAMNGQQAQLRRILQLTRPGDPVMDGKGLAIFRARPTYWALEGITEQRLRDRTIADDIPERLAATSTPLVVADRLPVEDRRFVDRNYFCVGDGLYIAGQRMHANSGVTRTFRVEIPQTYALVAARGDSQARIDGIDAQAPVFLAAGPHTLDVAGDDIVWLVWSAALQRGLSRADIVGGDMQHADCT